MQDDGLERRSIFRGEGGLVLMVYNRVGKWVAYDEAAATIARLSAENDATEAALQNATNEINALKDALAQVNGGGFGREE